MARYYSGDIKGNFWFGIQSSDAADRFGVYGQEPNYITYDFSENDLEVVEDEIQNIETKLGDKKRILDSYFEENHSYNDEQLLQMDVKISELSEYADLLLGYKIRNSIVESGSCSFEAEL